MSIPFSVRGMCAPYLKDLLRHDAILDGADDAVMAHQRWTRTRWVLEYPGCESDATNLAVADVTRLSIAQKVAFAVKTFLRNSKRRGGVPGAGKFDPYTLRFEEIRIVAFNYYGRVWVPVLALDIDLA
ncbi:hypothetical protein C8R46DRAFT_1220330 [Mycena filopes]|nr:hypothetical protein C8R46DRAFT_1220296 [Mycena filopes]KAJ7165188.1 hypothetical protein C8R46DRAFT_1220312 [Mycena filopes]KAJ7165208.1 hypothetical protein C8R46DRAFT_1220330 [Mycena filopes]